MHVLLMSLLVTKAPSILKILFATSLWFSLPPTLVDNLRIVPQKDLKILLNSGHHSA
jgi:hypothetical protein